MNILGTLLGYHINTSLWHTVDMRLLIQTKFYFGLYSAKYWIKFLIVVSIMKLC